ncbi:neuronal acetylcholine receptor subunit alpha-7 [Elysia marginata]|uniref:Neuronal acetylcholine receptor subunit alpha-7 n=1 Tax=Elysia marginata TaxID=1093978 RepID=A0AAV4J7J0_9GAST|nr:neuronal acetylcholine receptor subunit alpha-7 [Elysia marginata]
MPRRNWMDDVKGLIVFYLKLKRKPQYYVTTILLPVIVTSLLCGMVFLLPAESGEKVGYSLTVLLTYSVIITLVASYMPPTSKHTSVLSVYNTIILFIGGICVLLTVFVLYCYHQPEDEEPPSWLLALTRNFLAPIAKIKGKRRFTNSSEGRRGSTPDGSQGGKAQLMPRQDESSFHNASDVKVVGLGGRKMNNNAVHPQTPTRNSPRKVDEFQLKRRQSYHFGDPHSVEGLEYSWQDISVLLDSACIRLFGVFVTSFTVIILLVLMVGGEANA